MKKHVNAMHMLKVCNECDFKTKSLGEMERHNNTQHQPDDYHEESAFDKLIYNKTWRVRGNIDPMMALALFSEMKLYHQCLVSVVALKLSNCSETWNKQIESFCQLWREEELQVFAMGWEHLCQEMRDGKESIDIYTVWRRAKFKIKESLLTQWGFSEIFTYWSQQTKVCWFEH
jgi:hypothetical protein